MSKVRYCFLSCSYAYIRQVIFSSFPFPLAYSHFLASRIHPKEQQITQHRHHPFTPRLTTRSSSYLVFIPRLDHPLTYHTSYLPNVGTHRVVTYLTYLPNLLKFNDWYIKYKVGT